MQTIGIICEYNPFHNGHLYHLEQIKKRYPDSRIVLVMSGNFTQRGEPSLLNKWQKTEIALKFGVDLVIELPFPFATQSADIFAKGAIQILNALKVDRLVFGSESNDIELLNTMADIQLYHKDYASIVKHHLKKGNNYPTAMAKALDTLSDQTITAPNDLLGLSYVKAIKQNHSSIIAETIQRTNDYHDVTLSSSITSATSLRKALSEKKDISNYVPSETISYYQGSFALKEQYFPFLKYQIFVHWDHLEQFLGVDEGIEQRIKKVISQANSYEEFIHLLKTKRYTYQKINRMLLHILCNFTKQKSKTYQDVPYLRILGFSKEGQTYLHEIKKEVLFPIVTSFSKNAHPMLLDELFYTEIYSLIFPNATSIIRQEYQKSPIKW